MKFIFLFVFVVVAFFVGGYFGLYKNSIKSEKEAQNLKLVTDFYLDFFNNHNVDEASEVVAEDYIQHNPFVPDGKEPFVSYFRGFFEEHPASKVKIARAVAEGDLVWLHLHSVKDETDLGEAVIDIFRVENGMIVEHWDVVQEVPAASANENTMF